MLSLSFVGSSCCFLQLRGQGPHRHREWPFGAEKAGVGMGGSSGSGGHRLLTSWWEMLRPVQWTDGDWWWFNIAENERIAVAIAMCYLHALHRRTLLLRRMF